MRRDVANGVNPAARVQSSAIRAAWISGMLMWARVTAAARMSASARMWMWRVSDVASSLLRVRAVP
jgi:hypothetical protein